MSAKAQHFVPQVYLRNFAFQRKKEHFVYCFDKVTGKIFTPNIKNVANQTGFYNFQANGEKASIEDFFHDIETKMKLSLDALNNKPNISTLLDNQAVLAEFIVLQETRTLIFRHTHDDMVRMANKRLKGQTPFFREPTENDTKEFQARFILDMGNIFTDVLLKMKWILILNQTYVPFWISDNPIFRFNPHKADLMGNLGLESPGVQLHFPVSPTLAIGICDPFEYSHHDPELKAYLPHVEFNNSGQVINSGQYLFSANKDFAMAQEMIRRDAGLANPRRPRMILANDEE